MGDDRPKWAIPNIPQLVRFKKRLNRALDHLESASAESLDALRAFDGDALPLRFPAASAWETVHSAEAAIPALKSLVSLAIGDAEAQLAELRAVRAARPSNSPGRGEGSRG